MFIRDYTVSYYKVKFFIKNYATFLTGICFSYSFSEGRYVLNYPLFIALASFLGGVALVVFSFTVYKNRKPRRLLNA